MKSSFSRTNFSKTSAFVITAAVAALVSSAAFAHSDSKDAKGGKGEPKGECHGINSCKGQGACGGKGTSCAGTNECKGKGWLETTKAECDAKKGTFKP